MAKGSGDWQIFRSSRVSQLRFVGFGCLDIVYPPGFLTGVSCTFAYGVCWSFGGRAHHREDDEVGGIGCQSGSWEQNPVGGVSGGAA